MTIVIVTWNSAPDIRECLTSIMDQSYANYNVIVVDSGSTDGTPEIVRAEFPSVEVIASKKNLGYRCGNRLGMQKARGDYVVVCNDDVVVHSDWLDEMVRAMENDPEIGMVTPRIVMYDEPEVMNSAGNTLHFSGLYGPRAKHAPVSDFSQSEDVAAVSGCCFMIRRNLMMEAGGFSLDFDRPPQYWHASYEEVDLGWHVQMMGYRLRYVANSVMYHKYMPPSRGNMHRWIQLAYGYLLFMIRNLEVSALLLVAPAIVLTELSQFLLALSRDKAWARAKVQTWKWFLHHGKDLIAMRKALHPLRRRSYWQLLPRMAARFEVTSAVGGSEGQLANVILNGVFWLHHRLLTVASRLCRRSIEERGAT